MTEIVIEDGEDKKASDEDEDSTDPEVQPLVQEVEEVATPRPCCGTTFKNYIKLIGVFFCLGATTLACTIGIQGPPHITPFVSHPHSRSTPC